MQEQEMKFAGLMNNSDQYARLMNNSDQESERLKLGHCTVRVLIKNHFFKKANIDILPVLPLVYLCI